jgi:enamine deaminase RidA (YjgF/YER057c/UK114 family)
MERRVINPWTWQDQYGFVQANEVSGVSRTLICAGQAAIDPEGKVAHAGDIASQAKLSFDNLETVLKQAGFSLADVVRLTIYTTDVDALLTAYAPVAARLAKAGCRSAQTLLGVARLAFPEMLVEIEATAMK